MRVGVPKEIKTHEYRVGLTPGAVREYVAAGHTVLVEANAGAGIGATDNIYRKAGATILESAREVFASSEMVIKVKEPQASEWTQLRESWHQTLSRPKVSQSLDAPRLPTKL